jgi:hypothetical protein
MGKRADNANDSDALRLVVEGTVCETGTEFFRALVKNLAAVMDTPGAWVTEYLPELRRLRAHAFWLNGAFLPHYEHALNGTACQATDAIAADPAKGQTNWKVSSHWRGGTRSDAVVKACKIGGTEVAKDFTIRVDEPLELGGTNQYANPQEYLVAALNACMIVGYSAVCAREGIEHWRTACDSSACRSILLATLRLTWPLTLSSLKPTNLRRSGVFSRPRRRRS